MPKVHIDSLVGLEGQLALRTVETLSRDFLHPLTFDEWRGSTAQCSTPQRRFMVSSLTQIARRLVRQYTKLLALLVGVLYHINAIGSAMGQSFMDPRQEPVAKDAPTTKVFHQRCILPNPLTRLISQALVKATMKSQRGNTSHIQYMQPKEGPACKNMLATCASWRNPFRACPASLEKSNLGNASATSWLRFFIR